MNINSTTPWLTRMLATPAGLWSAVMLMGFLGANMRYAISLVLPTNVISWSTFSVNILGCFLLALVNEWLGRRTKLPASYVKALGVGFIGSFTTFSAVMLDSFNAISSGHLELALAYMAITFVTSFAAVWLGHIAAGLMAKSRLEQLKKRRRARRSQGSKDGGAA